MRIQLLAFAFAIASPLAQGASVAGSDPAAAAGVRPLQHDSGLRPATPRPEFDPAARWREHNDRVRELGGHMGHVRNMERDAADAPQAQEKKQ